MLYAGRPELPLPPAPDTLGLQLYRVLLAGSGSALATLAIGLALLWLSEPESYRNFLIFAAVPVYVWFIALGLYLSLRQFHEERYWTPERVARQCPAIWRLYDACNARGQTRNSRLSGLRR